jgi:hypothetical protein
LAKWHWENFAIEYLSFSLSVLLPSMFHILLICHGGYLMLAIYSVIKKNIERSGRLLNVYESSIIYRLSAVVWAGKYRIVGQATKSYNIVLEEN